MRKIVTLVFALVAISCWAQKPISDSFSPSSYGACSTGFPSAEGLQDMNDAGIILMPDGSHVIIAVFTTHSPSEAVVADIAKQLLEE